MNGSVFLEFLALRLFCPFCRNSISVFIAVVLHFLFSLSEMNANTVYARAQAAILLSSGHSVKDTAKLLKNTERWVNKWSKRAPFEDQPRSGQPSVLTNRARTVIEKAKYKRNYLTRKIAKNLQRHNINVSNTTFFGGI